MGQRATGLLHASQSHELSQLVSHPRAPHLNPSLESELCLQAEKELSSSFCWDKLVSEERSLFITEIRSLRQKTAVTKCYHLDSKLVVS